MPIQQITASDIAGWDSLQDIADTFEKRGLKPQPNLGGDHELVLQLADDEFVTIVEAGPGESATDFKPQNRTRHTNFVATNDYENFTFLTRVRSWEGQQHGRIKHQKLSFSKGQFESKSGEKNTILQKLNSIEYGSSAGIYDTLYDTQQVVKEFYQQFESLRTDLVQEVSGIPDDRGDAKQRYVQVILDRMIFLYFIQEKRLLDRNPDYLHEQPSKVVDESANRYEDFYAPLFFDYLAEDKQNPEFGKLPYLNGGLFAKNPVEEEFEDAKLGDSPENTNELFDNILDFLSDWNWNVDERLDIVDPKNLSPAVLGHIFEQTVNQKEMGAYYTPEEVTGFMARRTVHPYLLDQLNETVGGNYEEIDDVFGFTDVEASGESAALADGGMVTQQAPTENVDVGHIETLYHDILKEASIIDPAVGSGAFLLAVQEVLLDLYMQCIEFFYRLEDEGKGWELSSKTRDELDTIASGKGNAALYAKRTIILNNLYGVDIDEGAVEICKLRLWLSMVADIEDEPGEVEPLPNIDFNIRQGNSLIGFTELVETSDNGDATLANYGGGVGDSVRKKYDQVIDAIQKHKNADNSKEAANWRRIAEERIERYRGDLNEKILERFRQAGVENVSLEDVERYSPFHWVLEFAGVYSEGGFNVIIGNPPWDVLTPNREEFFSRYDEVFRSRTQNEKEEIQEDLIKDPEVKEQWEKYQHDFEIRAHYFNNSPDYTLQKPEVAGKTVGNNQNDLSALFFERVFKLAQDSSRVAQILPGVLFNGSTQKDLRVHLLENTTVNSIVGFENNGIFDDLHQQYKFGVVSFKNSGKTDNLRGIFQQKTVDVLTEFDKNAVGIPAEVLLEFSPEARMFPYITSQQEVSVLSKVLEHPSIGEDISGKWKIRPYSELHGSKDSEYFVENESKGDYPIYQGKNIYQFSYDDTFVDVEDVSLWGVETGGDTKSANERIRKKNYRDLKRELYDAFDGNRTSKSQKSFVNDLLDETRGEPLSDEDVRLDSNEERIVFREVTNSTNERTLVASLVPKDVLCVHTLTTVKPQAVDPSRGDLQESPLHGVYKRSFTDEELLVALGLLNSIPFDFLMRTKVDSHIVMYKLNESQLPRLTQGDDWFNYISKRAARLNCYGEKFEEMRKRLGDIKPATDESERQIVQAEMDAAAFHAYGLDRDDTEFVLENFYKVSNPRVMTEDYFDMVFEKYDELEQEGPHP